ncbi:MAG TPA: S41 family peptidase [Thermoanaerobaculia bacterium]|jgi:C-terminal processing protease CtpA/Prc
MVHSSAAPASCSDDLTEEECVSGLAHLWAAVKRHFVNFDLVPGIDWDTLYRENLPRVRQATTVAAYYQTLRRMVAKLRDGHTGVTPPEEIADEILARPLLVTRWIAGRVLVAGILDERLERTGIAHGQEIVAVDGVPVREYAGAQVEPYMNASTPQDLAARTFETYLLAGPLSRGTELTLRHAGGGEVVRCVPRARRQERTGRLAERHPPVVLRVLPGGIAHLALNTFDGEEVERRLEEVLPAIVRATALVLDIRENTGGNTAVGFQLLGRLTGRRHLVGRWRRRSRHAQDWGSEGSYQGETWLEPVQDGEPYARPVAVLTSARTYSAAEDFAAAFDTMERGLLVGEPTGGCTGQPFVFSLPRGGSLRVCSRRDTYPDGREFVGIGVQPDHLVQPTLEDFRAGRDTVLDAALDEISRGLSGGS